MAQKTSKVVKKPAGKPAIASKGGSGKTGKAASHSKSSTKTAPIKAKSQVKAAATKSAPTSEPLKAKIQTNSASTKTAEKKPLAKIAKIEKKADVAAAAPKRAAVKAAPQKVAAAAAVAQPAVAATGKAPAAVVAQAKAPGQQVNQQRAIPAVVKPAQTKLTAPSTPAVVVNSAPAPVAAASASQAAAAAGPKKPVSSRHGFKTNESIVYPAHGVGRIIGIEEQEIAGITLELFVIQFEKDKMTLRVPTSKLASVGMRKLAEDGIVSKAMDTLKGKARIKRTMWSRRAQEYEAKINSGDLVAIAEVVRDLYRSEAQPEQSYSERQLYEAALDRMAREIAAVDKVDERGAMQRITEVLSKSAKGRRAAEEEVIAAEASVKAA